ncbi:MAG: chromophore lyase CpcT/CpeT [Nostocaceae cyanobacterium]|nr:chromophore lyase CpcT/CpeT [Nostocaceae cyanobacterium]
MNKTKVYALAAIVSAFTIVQENRAAAVNLSSETQVEQVSEWFIGDFDNSQQVAGNPAVPLITMSNCSVQLDGGNQASNTRNVYLEQESLNRIRLYSFGAGGDAVNLSIRSFVNPGILDGICDRPQSQRTVNFSNLVPASCDIELFWESERYTGSNAPDGCTTSSGFKVVSDVVVQASSIDSLDKIFSPTGQLLVATPIEFRRVSSIPEPSLTLGILALGLWSLNKNISQRRKQKSPFIRK